MRLLILGMLLLTASAAEACEVKLVFNRWCLGDTLEPQMKNGQVLHEMEYGGQRRIVVKAENGPDHMLAIFEGRVSNVSRIHKPGTALVYRDLLGQLTTLYGAGEDRGRFPGYADDWDSRETAIRLKKGRAVHLWRQGPFNIMLLWGSGDAVTLSYSHNDLTKKAMDARPSDL